MWVPLSKYGRNMGYIPTLGMVMNPKTYIYIIIYPLTSHYSKSVPIMAWMTIPKTLKFMFPTYPQYTPS